jgi:hypothetical protein
MAERALKPKPQKVENQSLLDFLSEWKSTEEIRRYLGLGEKLTFSALHYLQEEGLIEVRKRRRQTSLWRKRK